MVFGGNPGTAKTTVAKLFAGIVKEKGILKSGAFVERDGMDIDGFGCVMKIIEAILSDNVDFSFDDILKSFVVKDITEEEAVDKINQILYENNSELKIQVVIRSEIKDYLHYSHFQELSIKN